MTDFRMDWDRMSRTGTAEAVLCDGKSTPQIDAILAHAHSLDRRLLLTRLAPERYAKREMCIPDGFVDRYFGKDYAGTHHTELFSCGMEAVTHGRFGGLTGRPSISLPAPGGLSVADRAQPPKADTEHLGLVLGLLTSANKRLP